MGSSDDEFAHLHVHSEYSLLDGASRLADIVGRVGELGQRSVAITDHGVLSGTIAFYESARAAGVTPIIGCEVYVADGSRYDHPKRSRQQIQDDSVRTAKGYYHLILLAKDRAGYGNLIKLVSRANTEGYYYKPRVDHELLAEHSDGLIALSGCLGGEVPQAIVRGDMDEASRLAHVHRDIFGDDSYFFEIQNHGIPSERTVREGLAILSRKMGIPLVATADTHYTRADDSHSHEILLAMQTRAKLSDEGRFHFDGTGHHITDVHEMRRLFPDFLEAVANTVHVAERCQLDLSLDQNLLPQYKPIPDGIAPEDYLAELCQIGMRERFGDDATAEARDRLAMELDVITSKGFAPYFLIVSDFIRQARCDGTSVGPGRGSAAGSLVAYLLQITDIDPLKYGLLFERFLTKERVSLPDIDVDFDVDGRGKVIDYVRHKYGEDHVAQIITFGTLAARGAIRKVGGTMGLSVPDLDKLAKLIPKAPGMTIDKALATSPEFAEAMSHEWVRKVVAAAKRLEGITDHASTHASGVVITPQPLIELIPVQRPPKDKDGGEPITRVVAQFDMTGLERVGALKIDLLGLANLTSVKHALSLVRAATGQEIDIRNLPLDDDATYALLGAGDTTGVFQFEGGVARKILMDMRPTCLSDLAVAAALNRPGPLEGKVVELYIHRRQGIEPVDYMGVDEYLEPILSKTHGVIIYQDQVMEIARAVAGYSLGEADQLRSAMGKKNPAKMAAHQAQFVDGAACNGITASKAQELFDYMAKFANYGFNKAHAHGYALIVYSTAYLKAHHPLEYMPAYLSIAATKDMDKVAPIMADCVRRGITIGRPDVNRSQAAFTPGRREDAEVLYGLGHIKNVGARVAAAIVRNRTDDAYTDLFDLVVRNADDGLNKPMLEALVRSGACDDFGDRKRLLVQVDAAVDAACNIRDAHRNGQLSIFETGETSPAALAGAKPRVRTLKATAKERLRWERDLLGAYISGHPLEGFASEIAAHSDTTIAELGAHRNGQYVKIAGLVKSVKKITTRKGKQMAFVTIEDLTGTCEATVFSGTLGQARDVLANVDLVAVIEGKVDCPVVAEPDDVDGADEGSPAYASMPRIVADKIINLDELDRQPLDAVIDDSLDLVV